MNENILYKKLPKQVVKRIKYLDKEYYGETPSMYILFIKCLFVQEMEKHPTLPLSGIEKIVRIRIEKTNKAYVIGISEKDIK